MGGGGRVGWSVEMWHCNGRGMSRSVGCGTVVGVALWWVWVNFSVVSYKEVLTWCDRKC